MDRQQKELLVIGPTEFRRSAEGVVASIYAMKKANPDGAILLDRKELTTILAKAIEASTFATVGVIERGNVGFQFGGDETKTIDDLMTDPNGHVTVNGHELGENVIAFPGATRH